MRWVDRFGSSGTAIPSHVAEGAERPVAESVVEAAWLGRVSRDERDCPQTEAGPFEAERLA